ncbi:MAG: multifunctional oxoglutarate decarboxylase/oxoglutarate dehydrogenase thiamine pyrophosphate-binding subunit/dihydrolipoyllysine-residue succinyltransferase subunit [Acidimicrobiales bacterium]
MPEPLSPVFGPNAGLVDEMHERFLADPSSVSESWRDFFEDYRPEGADGHRPNKPSDGHVGVATNGSRAEAPPTKAAALGATPLRGAQAAVAAHMESSLSVPTATSVRVIPARLLEVNRKVLNGHLGRVGATRVSFTHLIGYAVVRALAEMPAMRATYSDDGGRPSVVKHDRVGLGLAIDWVRPDGSRTLMVPCLPDADTLGFAAFQAAYEELVRKVRSGRAAPDDFAGVTLTLTNPGTLGTVQSVPRLMAGQSVIVGIGALGYPAEFEGADRRALAQLGISKVVTVTSTYDHRVIQGAESGLFLARVHELLLGADGFYDDVFRSLGVPYEAVRWRPDSNPPDHHEARLAKQVHVQTLINMYRVRGHLIADLDPLSLTEPRTHPELDPASYGLTIWDLDREFFTDGVAGSDVMTLGDVLGVLRDAYCRRVGVEYMHVQEPEQKRWIQEHVEGVTTTLTTEEQLHILGRLNAAEAFERFLHTKFVGHKRFGLEGAESAIALLDELLDCAARADCTEAVLGMAHRGRLNVLANIVGQPLSQIFRGFEGDLDPATIHGSGDVRYHLGASGVFRGRSGRELPVALASNPSHLEAVDPVVEGMVRAKQDLIGDPDSFDVLPVLVHGDAAFAGQGVVAETLNLSGLRGYRVGGTIHLVVNNQLGFTTAAAEARSSVYPTDVAKMVQAPILHVNGDDPEACVRVARLAFGFRQRFRKDVVIDMFCYRRHGHNETDDPSYTQPLMYKRIEARRSVRKLYTETLMRRGDIGVDEAEKALDDFVERMRAAFDETRQTRPVRPTQEPPTSSEDLEPATAVDRAVLDRVVAATHRPPDGFTIHPKLVRQMETRSALYASGQVEWTLAESLAFGSLLLEGTDLRLSGQDSRRGTFSQRHAVLVDYETGREWVPLTALGARGRVRVYDSLLSEYAALGFEYGYSTAHPRALVAWEAQFGDFVNGAQVVVDQFIAAAESKWGQTSGLVLLLPHGYEGQGPEHSSARLERFLTLCADGNLRVANPTTAAQYFHVLRRQCCLWPRRPLVVLTPKSLLRARQSRSPVEDFVSGRFEEVLDDPAFAATAPRAAVRRVVLTSGKVSYDAMARRDAGKLPAAVVRLEQLYPWPATRISEVLASYPEAAEVSWLQEEPENMGAWSFVHARLEGGLPGGRRLTHVSRRESASPATGSHTVHQREQERLLDEVFVGLEGSPPGPAADA